MVLNKLKSLIYFILRSMNPVLSKSRGLTHLRYFFIPEGFLYEQYATLCGIKEFEKRTRKHNNIYILRRNIHRLEKGLTYPNKRKIFAKDYILETIANLQTLVKESTIDLRDFKWAYTILKTYFDEVDKSKPNIAHAYDEFKMIPSKYVQEFTLKPKSLNTHLALEDFKKLAFQRRSVRLYQNRPVSRHMLDKAIEIANRAPSACNRQPFEFRIYDDKKLIKKIASVPFGTAGFVDNFPCFILVVGKLDAFFHSRDRHVIYIDASLAVMSFIFALETQGLSSCIYNWVSLRRTENQLRNIIKLEKYEMVVTTISVGYAKDNCLVPASVKKDLSQIRNYNTL